MKLFIDTANIDEIKEASRLGLIDGVTTNPTLIAREGKEFMPLVKEICQLVDGPISLEAVSSLSDDMLKEARDLAQIHPNAVVKLPLTRDGLMVRMDEKDWDMVLDINLKGAFLMTRTAAKYMMKQRSGRIVNISSVVGLIGNAGQVNYSASKAGLIGLTKSSARELATRGVTINAIAPGFIETDMTRNLSESARENLISQITLSRLGTPDDIASAVLFLASDDASYITGQVLAVDGGIAM